MPKHQAKKSPATHIAMRLAQAPCRDRSAGSICGSDWRNVKVYTSSGRHVKGTPITCFMNKAHKLRGKQRLLAPRAKTDHAHISKQLASLTGDDRTPHRQGCSVYSGGDCTCGGSK